MSEIEPRPVIAIVDDNPRMLESLEDLVESGGYVARSFLSAASLIDSGLSDLDVLITDIGMPDMDGLQLRDLTKKARPDLPVFLITGRHELADDALVGNASGLFRKPFDAAALLSAIAGALRERSKGAGA